SWPWGWIVIGAVSFAFLPLGLWSAFHLRVPSQTTTTAQRLPIAKMLPEIIGYASFGLGYIVYLTFLSAWLTAQSASPGFIALVWVTLGSSIFLSPFVWRPVLAKFASGVPLAMILAGIAVGSATPVILSDAYAPLISAVVFGLSVFMAPGAVTSFARKNLPPESWGRAIGLFTVIFAIAQTISPYGAGLVGDAFGDIGISLLIASGVLLTGAAIALLQRPLDTA
ncbi:MAG: YbfB/YjiJ family MFS transporter, partial [Pseudopelagicola sp.]|nr:YbfB/YjiJ family MFS transporter [Pseudopelagicola sp.]